MSTEQAPYTPYNLEAFEAAIVLLMNMYIQTKPVTKAEMEKMIDPRVIDMESKEPLMVYADQKALAALIDEAKMWYMARRRDLEEELEIGLQESIDQLLEDLDGDRYLRTQPRGFYKFMTEYYLKM